jgi:hypothetical protein
MSSMPKGYQDKPRVGWVHPKEAQGPDAKEACNEAGAGNIMAEPPALVEIPNPRPTVTSEEYPTPRDSGLMADGTTGGNYDQGKIPDLQVQPGEEENEEE